MASSVSQEPPMRVGYTERHCSNFYPNFKKMNLNPRVSKWSRREECHPTYALPLKKEARSPNPSLCSESALTPESLLWLARPTGQAWRKWEMTKGGLQLLLFPAVVRNEAVSWRWRWWREATLGEAPELLRSSKLKRHDVVPTQTRKQMYQSSGSQPS